VNLSILAVLIFLVTMALVISALYFIIEAPAARKRLRDRIVSAPEASLFGDGDVQLRLMRAEAMSHIPTLNSVLILIPGLHKVSLFIQQSAVEITVGMFLFFSLLLAWFFFLVTLLAGLPFVLAAVLGVLSGFMPSLFIGMKRQKRMSKFEELLPDAIDLLARAVRAGHAFTTGLDMIAKELPSPICEEFRRTYELQNLGIPIREAFQNLTRRVPLPDVRIFVTALTIQRETGGNLAEILDNLSHVMRERFKLVRQIQVFTAQGRMSMYMLVSMPPITGILIFLLNRDYIMRLFTDPLGHRFIGVSVFMQIIGYFVIRRIIQPRI
jgi:tight adherence protein B